MLALDPRTCLFHFDCDLTWIVYGERNANRLAARGKHMGGVKPDNLIELQLT